MKILVLHNAASEDAAVEERDVLVQRDAVANALRELGHVGECQSCTINLAELRTRLLTSPPDAVFNLVESLGGTDRLMPLAPLLLEALGVPFTGASVEAIKATTNKLASKHRLRDAGLPTPAWFEPESTTACQAGESITAAIRRGIVKAVWEHASFGIGDDCVVDWPSDARIAGLVLARQAATGRPHFCEEFIEGREFNLSLLTAGPGADPQVLPPAEIDFSNLPADKPRIVGYAAKWDPNAVEYHTTPRRFDYPAADRPLLDRLAEFAVRCWRLFDLRGYARVDFRVDREGRPWVLEINVNPCLAPDAGFAAALARAGIGFPQAIARILADAVGRTPTMLRPTAARSAQLAQ